MCINSIQFLPFLEDFYHPFTNVTGGSPPMGFLGSPGVSERSKGGGDRFPLQKTMGKPWENHGKMVMYMEIPPFLVWKITRLVKSTVGKLWTDPPFLSKSTISILGHVLWRKLWVSLPEGTGKQQKLGGLEAVRQAKIEQLKEEI